MSIFDGVAMTGINYSGLDVLEAVANSHERDAAWVERELGDVPVRIRGWFGETVPVE